MTLSAYCKQMEMFEYSKENYEIEKTLGELSLMDLLYESIENIKNIESLNESGFVVDGYGFISLQEEMTESTQDILTFNENDKSKLADVIKEKSLKALKAIKDLAIKVWRAFLTAMKKVVDIFKKYSTNFVKKVKLAWNKKFNTKTSNRDHKKDMMNAIDVEYEDVIIDAKTIIDENVRKFLSDYGITKDNNLYSYYVKFVKDLLTGNENDLNKLIFPIKFKILEDNGLKVNVKQHNLMKRVSKNVITVGELDTIYEDLLELHKSFMNDLNEFSSDSNDKFNGDNAMRESDIRTYRKSIDLVNEDMKNISDFLAFFQKLQNGSTGSDKK